MLYQRKVCCNPTPIITLEFDKVVQERELSKGRRITLLTRYRGPPSREGPPFK